MDIGLDQEHVEYLEGFRRYLEGLDPEMLAAVRSEYVEDPMQIRVKGREFLRRLGADGWIGVGWPKEHGGQGRSPIEQWLYQEELYYRRLPNGLLTVSSIGPVLINAGTPEQQATYLRPIMAGDLDFAIGYSEPNAGTDLASLRTTATRDGEEYVVNGQKIWTTGAQVATHIWLAARTGAPDSRHKGISLFIVPITTPGITIRPIYTQGGERTNEVFFDGVRVPAGNLVGGENNGWSVITMQLNYERLFSHNEARCELDQATRWMKKSGALDGQDFESVACQLTAAELAADLEVCRLFVFRAAWMLGEGQVPYAEASMNKVWWSELRQRICDSALGMIGEAGQIAFGDPASPGEGELDRGFKVSTVWKFGGGTNEIQRNIIAQKGLGMPR